MDDGETREAAAAALAYLREMTPALRGAEIRAADGAVLARLGDPSRLDGGEAFSAEHDDLSAVAVTDRGAPTTLTQLDLDTVVRDVARSRRDENPLHGRENRPVGGGGADG